MRKRKISADSSRSAPRNFLIGAMALVSSAMLANPSAATPQPAPPGGPLQHFADHDPDSTLFVDHNLWHAVLNATLGKPNTYGIRSLNYGILDREGRRVVDDYLAFLQGIDISILSRDEQLANWLNFYNAASFDITADEFLRLGKKRASGRDAGKAVKLNIEKFYLGEDSPWTKPLYTVRGVSLSLADIEHRILYSLWEDPNIMYGLSCPARSCPSIPDEPFTGALVHQQLAAAATRFMNGDDHVKVRGNAVELSQLYEWHSAKLGGEGGIIAALQAGATGKNAAALAGVTRISKYDFNWKLDGKAPKGDWALPKGSVTRGAPQ
ncbi:MAG: DUF547 domain-containing protein [Proteobacteria bacterium]|nr:DUF547 domain-containing protein [Pseudomonadota bacterium]